MITQGASSPPEVLDEVEQLAGDVREIISPALARARAFVQANEEAFSERETAIRFSERLISLLRDVRRELDLTATLLVADQPLLFAEVDRVRAEAELRLAVVPPLIAVAVVLGATWSWWFALGIPVSIVLGGDGLAKQQEGRSLIRDAIVREKASSNAVRQFESWLDASPLHVHEVSESPERHILVHQSAEGWTYGVDGTPSGGTFPTMETAEQAALAQARAEGWTAVIVATGAVRSSREEKRAAGTHDVADQAKG